MKATKGRQHQIRLRLTLPPDVVKRLNNMPSHIRSQYAATVLLMHMDNVRPDCIIGAMHEVRRVGVLVNQIMKAYWSSEDDQRPDLDIDLIEDTAKLVSRICTPLSA